MTTGRLPAEARREVHYQTSPFGIFTGTEGKWAMAVKQSIEPPLRLEKSL